MPILSDMLNGVIIVLHSTQLAENLGAVARVMGNFCLTELRLITPKASTCDPKAIATAAGAEHILKKAQVFSTLGDATADITHVWGTCADVRQGIRHYCEPEALFKEVPIVDKTMAILFGCERTGLSQDDLSLCQGTLQIPVNPDFSSMNLSHAVAIIAYAYAKATTQKPAHFIHLGETKKATHSQKQALFDDLIQRLDDAHYWRVPSKKPLMKQNLANLFFRMDLTEQEIRTLFGVFEVLQKPRDER